MKELGKMVDCTESAISMYELGRRQPDFETLLKLAEALDTSVSVILGESPFDGNKKSPPLERDERIDSIVELLTALPDEDRLKALGYIQALADAHK